MNQSTNYTGIGLSTAMIPEEGPKAIAIPLDFSQQSSYPIDLEPMIGNGSISAVQSMYVDNSLNSSTVTIFIQWTQQTIICPPNTQGYYTVLCPNPPRFTVSSAGGVLVPIQVLNVPVSGVIWTI